MRVHAGQFIIISFCKMGNLEEQRLIKHRVTGAAKFGKTLLGFYCAQGILRRKEDYRYIMVETMDTVLFRIVLDVFIQVCI